MGESRHAPHPSPLSQRALCLRQAEAQTHTAWGSGVLGPQTRLSSGRGRIRRTARARSTAPGPHQGLQAREKRGSGTRRVFAARQGNGKLTCGAGRPQPEGSADVPSPHKAPTPPDARMLSTPDPTATARATRGGTTERHTVGMVKLGWFGATRSRKANPGRLWPQAARAHTWGQGGRVAQSATQAAPSQRQSRGLGLWSDVQRPHGGGSPTAELRLDGGSRYGLTL